MVLVLGCPSVLVLPKEKPVVWVVMAWANGLLKRLVACWFCWPKRPPGFVPNPVVPFRKRKGKINGGGKCQTSHYLVTSIVYVIDYISKLPYIHSLLKLDNHFIFHLSSHNSRFGSDSTFYKNTLTPRTWAGLSNLPLWPHSFLSILQDNTLHLKSMCVFLTLLD